MIFQQDNDRKHTSKVSMDFFKANNYKLLFWPANSPDLNPIEHLWHYVKQQLQKYETPVDSTYELWERIQEVWNAIPKEVCENLVDSMPDRVQAVKRAKGRQTKY
jgi:transposase